MLKPDNEFLTVNQVLRKIKRALKEKKPFSLVRIGDGENVVLAQNSVIPIDEVLKIRWAKLANEGKKGVILPNLELRDEMVAAIKQADMVGIPFWENDPIVAHQEIKRPLTENVFEHFNIKPRRTCHTFVNRVFAQKPEFWAMLKGRRVLLISDWGDSVKEILQKEPYGLNIALTIKFTDYKQINRTLRKVSKNKDEFDIALISCGVNAVVLAPKIAQLSGKVSLDFGKSLMFIVKKKAGLKYSSYQAKKNLLR